MKIQTFIVEHAIRYGLDEAIILSTLAQWLVDKGHADFCYEQEGIKWLRLSMAQFQAELAYMSPYRIRTALEALLCAKLIRTEELEQPFVARRRRLVGYALTEKGYEATESVEEKS